MNVTVGLVGLRKMGRKRWVDGDGMKKGEWTAEEDQNLVAYINEHGVSDWRSLPKRAGIYASKKKKKSWYIYIDTHTYTISTYIINQYFINILFVKDVS